MDTQLRFNADCVVWEEQGVYVEAERDWRVAELADPIHGIEAPPLLDNASRTFA